MRDSSIVVAVVVVRTRPRAIPLAMITMRKSIHGFPLVFYMGMGLPLGRRSSAINNVNVKGVCHVHPEQVNRTCMIYQYSNMALMLSGQTSIFGVVFFVSKSPLGIKRQKKLKNLHF